MSRTPANVTQAALLGLDAAAEALGICERQLRALIKEGQLRFVNVGVGARPSYRIAPAEIQAFIANRTASATDAPAPEPDPDSPPVIDFARMRAERQAETALRRLERYARKDPVQKIIADDAIIPADVRAKDGGTACETSVYFISTGVRIKIGVAKDPAKRTAALQTGASHKLILIELIQGGRATERYLHKKFAHLCTTGEWFRFTPEIREFLRRVAG